MACMALIDFVDLTNTHVLVVGASSGMGRATAGLLHRLGAHVVMAGRDEQRLDAAASSVASSRERITMRTVDMTRPADRDRLFASLDRLDHLIVTAADLVYGTVPEVTERDMDTVLRSKIVAPFFLAQHAARVLPPTGSITLVSGIAAHRPLPTGVLTGTVNGALDAMVRGLAIALAPIRVNTVSPGWVDTPMWQGITDAAGKQAAFEAMTAKIPVRRIGTPDDVAAAIVAVLSNGFISGSTSYVDGGQRLV